MIFKHKTPIQIRFKDIDKMGHVNNANYLTYIEYARIHYIEDVVKAGRQWSRQLGLILARVEINYRKPVFLHDTISVHTRCSRLGSKSFDVSANVVRTKDGQEEVVAETLSVIVCFDYENNKTIVLPEEIKKIVSDYEGL